MYIDMLCASLFLNLIILMEMYFRSNLNMIPSSVTTLRRQVYRFRNYIFFCNLKHIFHIIITLHTLFFVKRHGLSPRSEEYVMASNFHVIYGKI